jgi:IS30 family transposase
VNVADKNNFAIEAQHRLVDLDLSVSELARQIGRPRSTVSRAIHTNKFPKVRRVIARRLGIKRPA